ncbi:hypothetical protein MYCTH_2106573 [Thermothelomyces thermophilus ATCC 42464]|uniref:Uncharacterized protein n=1 Tax=Thermothelomyces thermophilus (strain ATCC 42464 / BCRC 31852 / DSM 1799) TaxID=573729 RepID=G2Q5E0_THET4|nr:uncharacterized protein MYCTH_2106573 [Thermothelomyces thermophilus ATCC 42464]AEO53771.1 hypothetical protein MYCTH_2106573 [Thermothelomyces thermophilus ATCC 42464]
MATSQERYIAHPGQLQEPDIAGQLSDLHLADGAATSEDATTRRPAPPRLRLALLQPLADPAVLAACRKPAPDAAANLDDEDTGVVSPAIVGIGHEYLDITPLDEAWRKALAKAPPVSQITFDLRLPRAVGSDGDGSEEAHSGIYWETTVSRRGEQFALPVRNVTRLVTTIAIVARIRARGGGGDVRFELSYDVTDGLPSKLVETLRACLVGIESANNIRPRAGTVRGADAGGSA